MRTRSIASWVFWLVLLGAAGSGLRHYRIDNAVDEWMPDLRANGLIKSYLVIGADRRQVDTGTLATRLRHLPSVAMCVDPNTVAATTEWTGVSPERFVVGRDGSYVGLYVFRKPHVTDESFVGEVRDLLTGMNGSVAQRCALAGPAVFHVAMNHASQRRMGELTLAITVVGALLLWWITGRATTALTAAAAVAVSQVVLLGVVSWRRVPVDLSISMIPPMMMALGYSYAAHRALRRGATGILVLCYLTTALSIGSFIFTPLPPIRAFAIYGVLGLGLVWLAVIMLVPVPFTSGDRPAQPIWTKPVLAFVLHLVTRRPTVPAVVAAGVSLTAVCATTQLVFETDPLHYFRSNSPVVRDFRQLNDHLTGMLPFQIHVDTDVDPTPMLDTTPGVTKVIEVTAFANDKGRTYWCLADNRALPKLAAALPQWQAWAAERDTSLQWRGVAAQLDGAGRLVRRTALWALPLMALCAALVTGLAGRSWRAAAASVWVNLLPTAVVVLIAAVSQWPLGLPALMIGAISVGIAIDDTLHIVVARRHIGSIRRAVLRCWRPCLGSSLVAAACMSLFAVSPFGPIAQFGLLMAVAILSAVAADFLLLPVLLAAGHRPGSGCRRTQTAVVPAATAIDGD